MCFVRSQCSLTTGITKVTHYKLHQWFEMITLPVSLVGVVMVCSPLSSPRLEVLWTSCGWWRQIRSYFLHVFIFYFANIRYLYSKNKVTVRRYVACEKWVSIFTLGTIGRKNRSWSVFTFISPIRLRTCRYSPKGARQWWNPCGSEWAVSILNRLVFSCGTWCRDPHLMLWHCENPAADQGNALPSYLRPLNPWGQNITEHSLRLLACDLLMKKYASGRLNFFIN